jgi:hypothetical protein
MWMPALCKANKTANAVIKHNLLIGKSERKADNSNAV